MGYIDKLFDSSMQSLEEEAKQTEFFDHLKEIISWLDKKFKLVENDKLPVKLYVLQYLGILDVLPPGMTNWNKAILLSFILGKDQNNIRKRLSKISYNDNIENQIKHLTIVLTLFTNLSLKENAEAVERDLDSLLKKSNL